MLTNYLNILLIYLIRNKSKHAVNDNKITNPTIERLIKYINENYSHTITLRDISKHLHLTPNYLSALFYESTGLRFKDYLSGVRLKHARYMLEHTNIPISEIAHQCGFNDSNYFATAFKEIIGTSPRQYRKDKTRQ